MARTPRTKALARALVTHRPSESRARCVVSRRRIIFGCNTLTGWFEIKQVVYGDNDAITSFWAVFEEHCEDSLPAALGEIRFNADVAVVVTAPRHATILRGQPLTFDVSAIAADGS